MECSDLRDDMMDVLYGEAAPAKAERLEAHLKTCGACRDEMAGFRDVRRRLGAWQLPLLARPSRSRRVLPVRVLATAACVLLALGAGLGLSGSDLRYDGGRLSFHLGRSDAEVERLLAQQQSRFLAQQKDEIATLKGSLGAGDGSGEAAVMKRVEAMIRESDERHTQLLQARLDALTRRAETERRYDLARMSAGLSYLDGKTGQDVARTAELVGYVLQASEKR
ncbi:MAG TPA: zf-HC2 domain-containing protein [Vicinamibacteria bacterium]|jgi:hypothetical protein|nr:zf-HC2 domain-containing protein [Vicinamibacteria bacterium]